MDTIFAQATAPGKSGVAVVRVSGARAVQSALEICGNLPDARVARVRFLANADGDHLDQALVVWFPAGQSFTGEDVVEYHLHGSVATVAAMLETLSDQKGLRLAQPGEFTRRALENGCLDLTQVEALGDLLEAETEAQRKQALTVLNGGLRDKVEMWRKDLVRSAALLEAVIDFAEEDVPTEVRPEVRDLVQRVLASISQELQGLSASERIRTGFEVAIVGEPNVGKSTLLNALAGRDAAITSQVAGTTRDVIEVRMDVSGLPVTMLDTAGLRDTDDQIETLGIRRAVERANAADLRVFLILNDMPELMAPLDGDIIVYGMGDVTGKPGAISGVTGQGVESLLDQIGGILSDRVSRSSLASRERHRVAMSRAVSILEAVKNALDRSELLYDLTAEDLRTAIRELEVLVGYVGVENLLDEIFSSFCIGK